MSAPTDPWAPPKAAVAGGAGEAEPVLPPRPPRIVRAMRCVWGSYWLALLLAVWAFVKPDADFSEFDAVLGGEGSWFPLMLTFLAFWFFLIFCLNIMVGQGRNWARILYVALTALAMFVLPMELYWMFTGQETVLESLLNIGDYLLAAYACYLLLTFEGSAWFSYIGDLRSPR